MLASASSAPWPRTTSVDAVNSACEPPADAAPERSSTTDAFAPAPSSMIVRVSSPRPGSPAGHRTMMGRSSWTPGATWITTPWFQAARVSWASLSSAGSDAPVVNRRCAAAGSSRTQSRSGVTATPAGQEAPTSAPGAFSVGP